MEHYTENELNRFNKSWKLVGKCHLWQRYLDKDGYGLFYFRKKTRKAHRVSYYIFRDEIKNNLVVDHICRNRECVNPEHLKLVTKRENTLENSLSVGAVNKRKNTCKVGHTFDKIYGIKKPQRYCSICENAKSKRLRKKWLKEANTILC